LNAPSPTRFNRFLLPGFAFKAVVIGGGYATGRELAEFFLPSGPQGGLAGMLLAMLIWSAVCTVTFLFARATGSANYRTFFAALLGPAWFLFDIAYMCLVLIVLSVFAAAAGDIGAALFGLPNIVGTLCLIGGIVLVTTFGTASVERLFKYVTYFLYGVYVVFIVLTLAKFFPAIATQFAAHHPTTGWAAGGISYAGYNVVGAVTILPVLRHLTSNRDAVIAGLLCGPLAMLPAVVFFLGMTAFYPGIAAIELPSDYMLTRLDAPVLHLTFQVMIFFALLESGTGIVHSVNERVGAVITARGGTFTPQLRLTCAALLLAFSVFVAGRFGLVALIASGYRALSYALIAVFVLPLLTVGIWRVRSGLRTGAAIAS
jgi:uncharacterized membrane protein YkvI